MGWSSGPPRMVEGEAELEEGEAAFDDDKSIDLERDLSYLDEKVQSVLGHFQKDFEGGLSAENLGAKFGGYGSFLPTYQRSPPIQSQPKSPQKGQTQSNARSPISLRKEGSEQNVTAPHDATFSRKKGTAATCGLQTSQERLISSGDGSVRHDFSLASAPLAGKLPKKHQKTTDRAVVLNDQKPLKIRIKVGPDKKSQNNAAIYSGLGLTSPSYSTGNSLGESEGNLIGSRETPDQSLSSILQMLTSVVVAGGLLVSPLHEGLLSFKSNLPKKSKPRATVKLKHNKSARSIDDCTSLLTEDLLAKKPTEARKSDVHKEAKGGHGKAIEDDIHSCLKDSSGAQMLQDKQSLYFNVIEKRTSESIANRVESSRDSAKAFGLSRGYADGSSSSQREVCKDTIKGRSIVNESVKDESLASMSLQSSGNFREPKSKVLLLGKKKQRTSSQNDLAVGNNECTRGSGNINPVSFRGDTYLSEGERDHKGDASNLRPKPRVEIPSSGQDEFGMTDTANKFPLENKKNLKKAEGEGRVSLNSALESRRGSVSLAAKEKGLKKDSSTIHDNCENVLERNSDLRNKGVDMLGACAGDRGKNSRLDTGKEKNRHDRSKEKPKKFEYPVTSGSLQKDPQSDSLPSNIGPILGGEQATVAPILLQDSWVCCDSCQKWRLLPFGMKPEDLPEKWLCRMLNWLPGMNRCDISEEETTKALQALSQPPLPENQPGFQFHRDKSVSGVHPVDQQLVHHNNQSRSFDHMQNERKKIHKAKGLAVPTSKAKNFQEDVPKRESLKNRQQQFVGSNSSYKSSNQHFGEPEVVLKEHSDSQKQELVPAGDVKPTKKIKRELDQDDRKIQKRIKTEDALSIDFQTSSPNHGRQRFSLNNISGTKPTVKSENDYSQDFKVDERNQLQTSARKLRDDASSLLDTEPPGVLRKSNEKEIPSNKRKLKGLQNYPDSLPSRGNALVKKESSDVGLTRNKKLRVSQTDGKAFGRSKCTADLKKLKSRANPSSQLTMEDLESLKKDLGCDPVSTAATSSSSKVSDSRKTRSSYQEMKGSPVESVSSSPARMLNRNKFSPKSEFLGFDDGQANDFSANRNTRNFVSGDVNHVSKRPGMAKKRKNFDLLQPEAANNPVLDLLGADGGDKYHGESKVGIESSTAYGDGLNNNCDPWEGRSPSHTGLRASELGMDKIDKSQHSIHQGSLRAPSLPKDKDGILNSVGALEAACDPRNDPMVVNLKRSSRVETQTLQSHATASGVADGDADSNITNANATRNFVRRESRKQLDDSKDDLIQPGGQNSGTVVVRNISTVVDCGNGKSRIDQKSKREHEVPASKLAPKTQNGSHLHVRAHDVSNFSAVSKLSKDHYHAVNENEPRQIMGSSASDRSVVREPNGLSPLRKDASSHAIPSALEEAEGLRSLADTLKGSGFGFECNETYFQAALKFLHGASLMQNNSFRELNQLQIYNITAKLFESCAHEYERKPEMAMAALAYKCMEVAYMSVTFCKSSSSSKHWQELQASLQNVSQGESPSSSASDIDHLNNQAVVEKAPLSKSNSCHSGSHIIAPKNRPTFLRLLDFTKDVNSAMEATNKCQNAFVTAKSILEEAQNKEGILALKRVIDFSFQDVEEFVRLVRIAVESISWKGFGGSRE